MHRKVIREIGANATQLDIRGVSKTYSNGVQALKDVTLTDVMWPDFREADLASAVQAFAGRDRRYGSVSTVTGNSTR